MQVWREFLKVILIAALTMWTCAAPLVWLLQDGLGPDMIESGWSHSATKFLIGWGMPAGLLMVPLIVLWLSERRASAANTKGTIER